MLMIYNLKVMVTYTKLIPSSCNNELRPYFKELIKKVIDLNNTHKI